MNMPAKAQKMRMAIGCMIFCNGPMPAVDLIVALPRQNNMVQQVIDRMVSDDQLLHIDGLYNIPDTEYVRARYAFYSGISKMPAKPKELATAPRYIGEIAPPRSAPEERPLRACNIPSSAGRRPGTEARDIHFMALSSNVPVHWVGS